MNIGISIVSHNSEEFIYKFHANYPKELLGCQYFIVIIDNVGNPDLAHFAQNNNYGYIKKEEPNGYGANNNTGFDYLKQFEIDYFLVLNPDVKIDITDLTTFIIRKHASDFDLCGAKVVEDGAFKMASHNRRTPALLDAFVSLVFKKKLFLNDPNKFSYPDWIGGSFMLFKAKVFEAIKGFDESFFMYYEDADICMRAKKAGYIIHYDPSFSFFHSAQRAGHKLFSDHFFWNISSMIKFFIKHPPRRLLSKQEWGIAN